MDFRLWLENDSEGITVYHGSRSNGLKQLRSGFPPYAGGLGHGVYVGTQLETAQFYGPYVYELRTLFGWDSVLVIGEDNYEQLEGDSILVGESVPPFSFLVKGKKYAVTGGQDADDSVMRAVVANALLDLLGLEVSWRGVRPTARAWKYYPAITRSVDAMMRFHDIDLDRFRDEIEEWVYRNYDSRGYLPGEVGQAATQQHVQQRDRRVEQIFGSLQKLAAQAERVSGFGEEIGLEDVGAVVAQAGYKAVFAEGIRANASVNEEMLVFDERDLRLVRQIQ